MSSSARSKGSNFRNHETLPIAIVGGGLGGLALAIGLLKQGINVHIYESAPVFSEIGAGVTFGVNSMTALHLIDLRLLEGYKTHATFNADPERANTFMSIRWGMDDRGESGHKAGDFRFHVDDIWHPEKAQKLGFRTRSCIHRARLLEELVALLPEGITSFGKSYERVEALADSTLKLHFADGTTTVASALIGCDGIKSKVREAVCGPDVQAMYAGECAYRAMVPRAAAEAALGAERAFNGYVYCGYGACIVTYPVEGGDFINTVVIVRDVDKTQTWDPENWTGPATKDEISRKLEGWYPPLVEVICRFHLPVKWAMFHLPHGAQYHKGRICLLGDSAHAATPHLGAGAGMALEDAYILSGLVGSAEGVDDISEAFRAYDAVRRPRTQECIRRSADAGSVWDLLLLDVGDDEVPFIAHFEESFRWLWYEDLEAQLQKGKDLLEISTRGHL